MIRIHLCERGLEARRDQQVLEVLVAAVGQEFYNFFVCAHGANNLSLLERAGVVVVDHLENFTSRGQELSAELLVGGGRRALAALALLRHLLQALREAAVDRRLPFVDVHFSGVVRVQDRERLLEARRVQQEHQVLLAARLEERYHFLVFLDSSHNFALVQGPAAVLVDELEAAPGRRLELRGEFLDFLLRGLGLQLAPRRALGQLVRQRRLDAGLPA